MHEEARTHWHVHQETHATRTGQVANRCSPENWREGGGEGDETGAAAKGGGEGEGAFTLKQACAGADIRVSEDVTNRQAI